MTETLSIAEARQRKGLRLVMMKGFPSPWSQAARGILEIERIPFVRVHATEDDAADALQDWTQQSSYPAAMYEDEAPRSGWAEILTLSQRLAERPSLVPTEAGARARFFGYANEICGEMGLGWCRRLLGIQPGIEQGDPMSKWLGDKYGYRQDSIDAAQQRVVDILRLLDGLLAESLARGDQYLLGELSALDVYWATFCNLLSPLPQEHLPMPERMRPMFTATDSETLDALGKDLLGLRDRVYREHLTLPVDL